MSPKAQKIHSLIDLLPDSEIDFAYEVLKRMVLAWDSDYTKLTKEEREKIILAEDEIKNNQTIGFNEVNWN